MRRARGPIVSRSPAITVASIFILAPHPHRSPPSEPFDRARIRRSTFIFLEGPAHCHIPLVPSGRDEPAVADHAVAEQDLGLQALSAPVPVLGDRPAAGASVAGGQ